MSKLPDTKDTAQPTMLNRDEASRLPEQSSRAQQSSRPQQSSRYQPSSLSQSTRASPSTLPSLSSRYQPTFALPRSNYPSSLRSEMPTSSSSRSQQSRAPSFARSTLRTAGDRSMARSQLAITTLASDDRSKQEDWAQEQIRLIGLCPGGLGWKRVGNGYACLVEQHRVTDESLAEGMGGMFFQDIARLKGARTGEEYWGPYYFDERDLLMGKGVWKKAEGLGDEVPEGHTAERGYPVVRGRVYGSLGRLERREYERVWREDRERKVERERDAR